MTGPHRAHPGRSLVLAAVLAVAAHQALHARVFWRWKASDQATEALRAAGGEVAYEADVTVNGGQGHLRVYSFESLSGPDVAARLRRIHSGDTVFTNAGPLASMAVSNRNTVIRYISVNLPDAKDTLLLQLEQKPGDFALSSEPPDRNPLPEIPEFPGSRHLFFAGNDDDNARMAVSETSAGQPSVTEFYGNALSADGWQRFPAQAHEGESAEGSDRSALRLYIRGDELLCLLVSQAGLSSMSRITLLHKPFGLK